MERRNLRSGLIGLLILSGGLGPAFGARSDARPGPSYAAEDQIPAHFQARRTIDPGSPNAAAAPIQRRESAAQTLRRIATELWRDTRTWAKSLRRDYYRRVVAEIPMRDGVTLHTVIVIPNGALGSPVLLQRTPYGADAMITGSPNLSLALPAMYALAAQRRYIVAIQDVRGKYRSGGAYVLARPLIGPLNRTSVDQSTDAWDTIEWLTRHLPQSNRRVALIGASYDGFTAQMGAINPHPALKAAVVVNPLVDGWIGDDWFHYGAFRQPMMQYVYDQEATRSGTIRYPASNQDEYGRFLAAGSAGAFGAALGMDQLGFWRQLTQHPAYDAFWQDQALDKIVAQARGHVPTLYVAGLWDQEDSYGAFAAFQAATSRRVGNKGDMLVIGPWHHDGAIQNTRLAKVVSGEAATGRHFRETVLQPFLDRYLTDRPTSLPGGPVLAFETGANAWRRYAAWPPQCASQSLARLYVQPGRRLAFSPPPDAGAYDTYVSDPANPVPYRVRPIKPIYGGDTTWDDWLMDDQRPMSRRPDVLTYVSAPLTAPLRIAGRPTVNLVASTSGADSDWVVKLIDVYPDGSGSLTGYQLPLSMDIFRGRYRQSPSRPAAISPNQGLTYRFALPNVSHEFRPGHRIMVQVQSSWFPLYDRNPQTFVPNIFFARPTDYAKATQRIFHSSAMATNIELPVSCALTSTTLNVGPA
jgi:putative CocE/NonD family hydrolase